MPDGLFGFARNANRGFSAAKASASSVQSSRNGTFDKPRVLQFGERLVEDVTWKRRDDAIAGTGERARDDRQEIVGTVTREDHVGRNAVIARGGFAKGRADGIGIASQSFS